MTPLAPMPGRSGHTGRRRLTRPRGIALLMSLAVVMLLTFFMSEYFFATGLELRAMTTYKDAQQARSLARSVFKAVEVGLLQDEVDFFTAFRQLEQLLQVAAVPWNNGLLLTLQIAPQDHLFNLNQVYNYQQGEASDVARRGWFFQELEDVSVVVDPVTQFSEPIRIEVLHGLWAAIFDWIDSDSEDYIDLPGVLGAEAGAYFRAEPEIEIKNGMFDRLEEVRILRGVLESGIPWGYWEQRFTVLPRVTEPAFYFPERINVNVASREEIQRYLEHHWADPDAIGGFEEIQEGINPYAEQAEAIAQSFAPLEGEGERKSYNEKELKEALTDMGFQDNYGTNYLFSTVNENYRVRIVTEVAGVRARLEAMLNVQRDKNTRIGSAPKILWITIN